MLSKADVGHYAVAFQIASLPMQKIMGILNQVTLPAISRLQSEPLRARTRILQAVSVLSLVAVPIMWGISAIAPELVLLVLGDRWSSVVYPISVISLVIPARMISVLLNTSALGLGNQRADLFNSAANLTILPAGFLIGVQWGVHGLATSWLFAVPLVLSLTLVRTARAIGISFRSIVAAAQGPLVSGAIMYAAIAAARLVLHTAALPARLAVLIAVGAAAFCAACWVLAPSNIANARDIAVAVRGRPEQSRK